MCSVSECEALSQLRSDSLSGVTFTWADTPRKSRGAARKGVTSGTALYPEHSHEIRGCIFTKYARAVPPTQTVHSHQALFTEEDEDTDSPIVK